VSVLALSNTVTAHETSPSLCATIVAASAESSDTTRLSGDSVTSAPPVAARSSSVDASVLRDDSLIGYLLGADGDDLTTAIHFLTIDGRCSVVRVNHGHALGGAQPQQAWFLDDHPVWCERQSLKLCALHLAGKGLIQAGND